MNYFHDERPFLSMSTEKMYVVRGKHIVRNPFALVVEAESEADAIQKVTDAFYGEVEAVKAEKY